MQACIRKGLAVCFLVMFGFVIFAHGQKSTLTFKNGKATAVKTFQPRRKSDADFYLLKLRKGQIVEIKVVSKEVYLSEENACAIYFDLFDGQGKRVDLGDDPVGIDSWEGEIKAAGIYRIKVSMQCIESFTASELQKKEPRFKYSLAVQTK
jgi:hypothetical protein